MSTALTAPEKRELVEMAERIPFKTLGSSNTSQLRNLVQIAGEETDVKVLINFIRYQLGRKSIGDFWKPIHGKVIQALEDIEHKYLKPDDAKSIERTQSALQHFFGYLVRHYVYLSFVADGDRRMSRPSKPGHQHHERRR